MSQHRLYYDTCVFLLSLNSKHAESKFCAHLLDASRIHWAVAWGAFTTAEATTAEYVATFEIECARQGVEFKAITEADVSQLAKKHRSLKKTLSQLGFDQLDWKHLVAAASAGCTCLTTTDRDFWDPASKAKQGSPHPTSGRVFTEAQRCFGIAVCLPSQAVAIVEERVPEDT